MKTFILLLAISLYGCVSQKNSEAYPETWSKPKIIDKHSCPNLSGQYGFIEGTSNLDFEARRTLNFLNSLAGHHGHASTPNKIVLSHQGAEWFRIQTFVDNKLDLTQEFSNKNSTLRCKSTGLYLKPPSYSQHGAAGVGKVWDNYTFNLSQDGSLIFQRESIGAGMVLMMSPVIIHETTWHRLKQIHE